MAHVRVEAAYQSGHTPYMGTPYRLFRRLTQKRMTWCFVFYRMPFTTHGGGRVRSCRAYLVVLSDSLHCIWPYKLQPTRLRVCKRWLFGSQDMQRLAAQNRCLVARTMWHMQNWHAGSHVWFIALERVQLPLAYNGNVTTNIPTECMVYYNTLANKGYMSFQIKNTITMAWKQIMTWAHWQPAFFLTAMTGFSSTWSM